MTACNDGPLRASETLSRDHWQAPDEGSAAEVQLEAASLGDGLVVANLVKRKRRKGACQQRMPIAGISRTSHPAVALKIEESGAIRSYPVLTTNQKDP